MPTPPAAPQQVSPLLLIGNVHSLQEAVTDSSAAEETKDETVSDEGVSQSPQPKTRKRNVPRDT